MNNKKMGVIRCVFSDFHSYEELANVVYSEKTKRLYINCKQCGLIMPTKQPFQDFLRAKTKFIDDEKPEPVETQKKVSFEPLEVQKKSENKTILNFLFGDDND